MYVFGLQNFCWKPIEHFVRKLTFNALKNNLMCTIKNRNIQYSRTKMLLINVAGKQNTITNISAIAKLTIK